jgi:two-component system, cell cycle response regulator DivK
MPTILLVEDNDFNRDMLSRRLQRRGYEILSAADAEQAIRLAPAQMPDLILMDINLPGMDGWEATRRLRANEKTAAIPIIALTAHAMAGDREKTIGAGCDEYETKPVNLEGLLSKMEGLLAARKNPDPV